MYGSRQTFKGRISGFTMGTGSTLALLPAENATGNFVKVVQRLPVRIELVDYDPDKMPLFVGLSVTPYVYFKEPPTGPNAGQFLQRLATEAVENEPPPIAAARGAGGGRPEEFPPRDNGATASRRESNERFGNEHFRAGKRRRAAANRWSWLVALAVVVPTFMEVLDTTIANVALRYIAGGLSAAVTDSEWVITSYLAANAIILPISGWLSAHLGRRNYFLLSIAVFTLASALCGLATSLAQIIVFRVLQGLAGGGLQPTSQACSWTASRPKSRARRRPCSASRRCSGRLSARRWAAGWSSITTGAGSSTSTFRWVCCLGGQLVSGGRSGIPQKAACRIAPPAAELRRHRPGTAGAGDGSLGDHAQQGTGVGLAGRPVLARADAVSIVVLGFGLLLFREMRIKNPIINFRVLRDRNLAACCVIIFWRLCRALCRQFFAAEPAPDLVRLRRAGIGPGAVSLGRLSTILGMLVVGYLLGKGADARWLIPIGLLISAAGNYWMSLMNLDISPWQAAAPRVVLAAGLSFIFAPLNVAAFKYVSPQLRGAAAGMLALLRNEGGSVGTSLAQTIQERREQFHALRLNERLDPFNPLLGTARQRGQQFFLEHTGDPVASGHMTLQVVSNLREQQALSLAYFDVFWFCAVVSLVLIGLVFVMRPSAAEKGAHVGAE